MNGLKTRCPDHWATEASRGRGGDRTHRVRGQVLYRHHRHHVWSRPCLRSSVYSHIVPCQPPCLRSPSQMQKGRSVSRAALAKNLDFFSLQPLVLVSSCLVPIERSNDTKHVWGLRAYAHPLAGRPADRIGHIALRDIIVVNEPVTTKSQQLSFKMFPPPPSQGGSVTTDVHEFRHVHVPVNIRGFVNIGRKSADKRNLQQRHLEEMLVVTP